MGRPAAAAGYLPSGRCRGPGEARSDIAALPLALSRSPYDGRREAAAGRRPGDNCLRSTGPTTPGSPRRCALGIDNIEIDLGWDAAAEPLIIGHDAAPRPGVAYPAFEIDARPRARSPLGSAPARRRGSPTVLTVDWKTGEPEAVRRFKDVPRRPPRLVLLGPQAARVPAHPAPADRLLQPAATPPRTPMTRSSPPGGAYRAFRDRVFGAGAKYEEDVATYIPEPATPTIGSWPSTGGRRAGGPAARWRLDRGRGGSPGRAGARSPTPRLPRPAVQPQRPHGVVTLAATGSPTTRPPGPAGSPPRGPCADWVASDEYREMAAALGAAVGRRH